MKRRITLLVLTMLAMLACAQPALAKGLRMVSLPTGLQVVDWNPVSLPASPFSGTVNGSSTGYRVYSLTLEEYQNFSVRTMADPSAKLVMVLYRDLGDTLSSELAWSDSSSFPQYLRYRTPGTVDGYYLIVFAATGEGTRTFYADYAISSSTSAADIPGVAASATGVDNDTVSDLTDWSRVYRFDINPGESVHLRLKPSSASGDADLIAYTADAGSIYENGAGYVGESSEPAGYTEQLMVTSNAPGAYYANVWAWRGTVDYSLEHTVTPPTALTIGASATKLAYGHSVNVTGTLTENSAPLGHEHVFLTRNSGGTWSDVALGETNGIGSWPTNAPGVYDDGAFWFGQTLTSNARFRIAYPGAFWAHSASKSTYLDVLVSAYLPTPKVPTVYAKRAFTAYGFIKPKHTAGTYPVTLQFYYGGKFVKSVKAKASNYSSYTKYAASVSLPYRGTWKVRAHHVADTAYAKNGSADTYSSFKSFTVH